MGRPSIGWAQCVHPAEALWQGSNLHATSAPEADGRAWLWAGIHAGGRAETRRRGGSGGGIVAEAPLTRRVQCCARTAGVCGLKVMEGARFLEGTFFATCLSRATSS